MSFSQDAGYLPSQIPELMNYVREGVNEQLGSTYDADTFVGTNLYKYFYALIQRLQAAEVKTSEIFLKLQQYFEETNEEIQRPNTTHPGIWGYFRDAGYSISTKPPEDADAGKLFICVDTDETETDPDYATVTKPALCNLVKDCCVGGVVSQGDQVEAITLPNGQSFDFKFSLPTRTPILLRLTLTLSANNQYTILSDAEVAQKLYDNIVARYRLGLDFEPQRYFSIIDAPWAADVLLEWSDDAGSNWHDTVFNADFDDLFTFEVGDITVVNA